jgi:transposase-like protein
VLNRVKPWHDKVKNRVKTVAKMNRKTKRTLFSINAMSEIDKKALPLQPISKTDL